MSNYTIKVHIDGKKRETTFTFPDGRVVKRSRSDNEKRDIISRMRRKMFAKRDSKTKEA